MTYTKIKLVSRSLAYFLALLCIIGWVYYVAVVRPIERINEVMCHKSTFDIWISLDKKIVLKTACSPQEIKTGYQNALVQPQQSGKIFVLGRPATQSFWMKNVPFELGLVYLDKDFKVLSTHILKPHNERPVWSGPRTAYALEINPTYLSYFPEGKIVINKNEFK